MRHFQNAIVRLTGLYVVILMMLSLACSIWLYSVAGSEITFVGQQLPSSGTVRGSTDFSQHSRQRLMHSLVFFNLFIFGAGTIASYALAKRTLRPIQKSYEAQAQFAADASHELRTPLTALKAELQLAQRKNKLSAAEYQAMITSSIEEVDRLSSLTERLLRLTGTAASPATGTASLLTTLTAAQRPLRHVIKTKHIHLIPPATDITLTIHPDDLTELLTIVLDNAVKYSPAHTTITIGMKTHRGQATLRIQDQGRGITEDDLPHIFERFHRGNHSDQPKGYGLGLAVAKKLVDSAGGTIFAQSKPGHGSTIIIQLPISV